MKQKLIAIIAIVTATMLNANAKVSVYNEFEIPFTSYASYLSESFDINVSLPNGFVDQRHMCHYNPPAADGSDYYSTLIGAMLRSADGECMVLMPDMWWRGQDLWQGDTGYPSEFTKYQVYWALKSEFYYVYLSQYPAIDLSKIVTQAKASKFSADTAYVATLPANDTIMGRHYTHRTHLVISKAERPIVEINVLYTDAGIKNTKKYLKSIFSAVKFGKDRQWTFDNERDSAARKKHIGNYLDFISKFIR